MIVKWDLFVCTGVLTISVWIWLSVLCKIPSSVRFSLRRNGCLCGDCLEIILVTTLKSFISYLNLDWPKIQVNFTIDVVLRKVSFSSCIYSLPTMISKNCYSSIALNKVSWGFFGFFVYLFVCFLRKFSIFHKDKYLNHYLFESLLILNFILPYSEVAFRKGSQNIMLKWTFLYLIELMW